MQMEIFKPIDAKMLKLLKNHSIHMAAHNRLELQFHGIWHPLGVIQQAPGLYAVQSIYKGKMLIYIKQK